MATIKEPAANVPQIYALIGKAMREIGAVGKDSVNQTQGFKYRGIDAVYNALNPVMSKYGLFIVPEILEQNREERTTVKKVWDSDTKSRVDKASTLIWSILKIRFTMYAPDGSNVSAVVIGEGMDTGDKATNKAMSIALKYAAFQMFMIPTEETTIDPDSESHEVEPKKPAAKQEEKPAKPAADVTKTPTVPALQKAVDTALSVDPKNTYIFGEIIHNPDVVKQITDRGIATVETLDDVPRGATLIIRSHGVGKWVYEECKLRNIKIVDCT